MYQRTIHVMACRLPGMAAVLCAMLALGTTAQGADNDQVHFFCLPSQPQPLGRLEVFVGRGEFEYVEINGASNADMKDVSLRLVTPEGFPGKTELLVEEDYRLLPRGTIHLKPGERNPIWIVFSTHGVGEGIYRFRLVAGPLEAPSAAVDLDLVVLPIDLPRLDDVYVSGFWTAFSGIFGASNLYPDVRDPGRMMQIWEHCVEDQRNWGQNMLEVRFFTLGRDDVIQPYISVVRFENDYLPVLDLSEWDSILDIARRNGMRHVVFRYQYRAPSWLPPGYEDMPEQRQREVDFFILRQLIAGGRPGRNSTRTRPVSVSRAGRSWNC